MLANPLPIQHIASIHCIQISYATPRKNQGEPNAPRSLAAFSFRSIPLLKCLLTSLSLAVALSHSTQTRSSSSIVACTHGSMSRSV